MGVVPPAGVFAQPIELALSSWRPQLLSALRIMTGLCCLQHGTAKLLGFPHVAMFDGLRPFTLAWIAGVLELVGGVLIVVGLFTRPTAFVLSGLMAFAYFIGHGSRGFFPIVNGGELAVIYCFVFLYLAAAGAGPWSVDAMGRRKP